MGVGQLSAGELSETQRLGSENLEQETTMPSKKTTVAAIAAFIAIVASPAFAGDQNVNTLLRDSGRYVPQVNEPATHYTLHARAPEVSAPAYDFQLQGR